MKKSLVCGICLVLVLLASACGPAATPPPAPIAVPPTETPLPPPTEAPVPPTATPAPRTLTVFAAASLTGSFGEIGKAFEAANPGDVREANERGQIPFTRIVQAEDLTPA